MFDLRAFLKEKNISQRDFSAKIGYSEAYISRVLSENSPMNEKLEAKVHKAYPEYFGKMGTVAEPEAIYNKEISIINGDPNGKDIPAFQGHAFATISPAMGDVVTLRPDTFIRIPMFSQGQGCWIATVEFCPVGCQAKSSMMQ